MDAITLAVEGMTCAGCETAAGNALKRIAGVTSVDASAARKRVIVRYHGARPDSDQLCAALAAAGYQARVVQADG